MLIVLGFFAVFAFLLMLYLMTLSHKGLIEEHEKDLAELWDKVESLKVRRTVRK